MPCGRLRFGGGRVQVVLGEDGSLGGGRGGTGGGAEHGAAGGDKRSKRCEAERLGQVVVDGFHVAVAVVGFVPEASAAGVFQEILPPLAVRIGASPLHKGVGVAPVLAHAQMHGKKREKQEFM